MRKMIKNESEHRLLSIEEASAYIGLGRCTARKFLDEIGATRKFAKRVVFDKQVIDKAIDAMGPNNCTMCDN